MNNRKNTTFNVTISVDDFPDAQLMSRAFFKEDERAQMKPGALNANFLIDHQDEQYQCCSTYTSTSPFLIFSLTDGDNENINTRNKKVEDRIKRLEDDAAHKTSSEDQTIIITISLHEDYPLTKEQQTRIENARVKLGAHLYRLTDKRVEGQAIRDLAEVETNKPILEEIRKKMLAQMVKTTHSIKTVNELERARLEEKKREAEESKRLAEESKRLAEEARIKKQREEREAAEAALIKKQEERAAHEQKNQANGKRKLMITPYKITWKNYISCLKKQILSLTN